MSTKPDRAIDRIVTHWKSTKGQFPKSVLVPEWGDLTVYWDRWTLREKDVCEVSFAPVLLSRHYVNVLLHKALSDTGRPLFSDADREELETEADPAIVQRVAGLIIRDLNGDYDAAKGGDAEKKE